MLNFIKKLEEDNLPDAMPRDNEFATVSAFLDGRKLEDGARGIGWWGITGRGKTHFRRSLEADLSERMKNGLAFASVSAEVGDSIDQLLSVRAQLARRSKMRFLLFDWAFVRYFQIVFPDADIRQRHANLFSRPTGLEARSSDSDQAADEILSWMMDLGKDFANASIDAGLSLVPSFKVLQTSVKAGAGLIRRRIEKAKVQDQIVLLERLTVEELRSSLAHCLAFDIGQEFERGKAPDQIVVMADNADLIKRDRVVHLPDHSWLDALMANCPKADFILFAERAFDCKRTGAQLDWHELPAFSTETIDGYLEKADINPFCLIQGNRARGEPLFAKLSAENGWDLGEGVPEALDNIDVVYRAYADAVLRGTSRADRQRAYLLSVFGAVTKEQYTEIATETLGPAEAMQWDHVTKLPFVAPIGECIQVVEPLKTSLKNTLVLLEPDVLKPLRAYLVDQIMAETERDLSGERFSYLLSLVEAIDWSDPETVPTLDAIFARYLRYTHEGTLLDVMDHIRREAGRFWFDSEAQSRLEAMLLRWKWDVACRRGHYDVAQEHAAEFYEHISKRRPIFWQDFVDSYEMGLEAHVMACTIFHASRLRMQNIRRIADNMESSAWWQIQHRTETLLHSLNHGDENIVRLDKNADGAVSDINRIVVSRQLSELPTLIEHLQRVAVEADRMMSSAEANYNVMIFAKIDVECTLELLEGLALVFARVGRLFCTLDALLDQGHGYLKLGAAMAYGLSLELGKLESTALAMLGELDQENPLSFRERMDQIEFDTECESQFPDGRRLGRLGAAIMESCMRHKQNERAISTGLRFDRITAEPLIDADDVDAARIFSYWAIAYQNEGRGEEAKRAYGYARSLIAKGAKFLGRDDIRTVRFSAARKRLAELDGAFRNNSNKF